jgi:hypothetical protein
VVKTQQNWFCAVFSGMPSGGEGAAAGFPQKTARNQYGDQLNLDAKERVYASFFINFSLAQWSWIWLVYCNDRPKHSEPKNRVAAAWFDAVAL